MNPVDEQKEILEPICELIKRSAPSGFSEAACRFDYFVAEDGSRSVGGELWFTKDGSRKSAPLAFDPRIRPIKLVPHLHKIMMEHTGGDWNAFTLTVDGTGKVSTTFEHPDP